MIRVFSQYVSPKSVFLIINEALLVTLSFILAAKIRFWFSPVEFEAFTMLPDFGMQVVVNVLVFQLCFYYNELYSLKVLQGRGEMFVRLWQGLGSSCVLLGVLYWIAPRILIGRGVFFISILLLGPAISLSRRALEYAWRNTLPPENILILGTGELAGTVARELKLRGDLSIRLAGFARPINAGHAETFFGAPILGDVEDLEAVVREHNIAKIVIALEEHRGGFPVRSLVNIRVRGVPVYDAHTTLAALTGRIWLRTIRPSWFVYSDGFHRSKATIVLKRIIDLCLGVLGLALAAPIMVLTAIAVGLESPGPILYRQKRTGLQGRSFDVLKFRSMRTDAEAIAGPQWASLNDPRVTRLGKHLRKYRLDELPQFFNVIRGEMSFVGPRPERPVFVEQLCKEIPYYDERHTVRPGITGWAQVEYPYGSSVEDAYRKLEYDLFYLKNMSIFFDCAIVFRTIRIVLYGTGAR